MRIIELSILTLAGGLNKPNCVEKEHLFVLIEFNVYSELFHRFQDQ